MDLELTPEDEKIIVNVKGVSAKAWERAKIGSHKAGETLGQWLSRACEQLANLESGQRMFPTSKTGTLPANTPRPEVDFREVAAVLMAMKENGLVAQKRLGRELNALIYAKLKDHREPTGKSRGDKLIELTHG